MKRASWWLTIFLLLIAADCHSQNQTADGYRGALKKNGKFFGGLWYENHVILK